MTARPTPLAAIARGVAAGVIGTAAMTASQMLYAKLQPAPPPAPDDQKAPEDPWEGASAPAQVGRRISEGVFHQEVPPERIGTLTNVMHWGYGTSWGAVFGALQGSLPVRPVRNGLLFGAGVMAMSYVQLVPMGIYRAPWTYSPKELAPEFGFHLVYGLGVAGGHRVLDGG